jgi:hypothetical protein
VRDFITLGAAPAGEEWARIDQADYDERARAHCLAYIRQLRRQFGSEPEGAELRIMSTPIPGGSCVMVVCYFETDNKETLAYALACGSDAPTAWDVGAKRELGHGWVSR